MKTRLILIICFLATFSSFACICDNPKPAIEFYNSDYVFEGKVIEKLYASDSLTYTVTFEISKHYKNGDNPKFLKFQLLSEGEITGKFTSCDWNVENGESWLIYATKNNEKFNFSYYCSNSKPINSRKIRLEEQKVLDNGNELDLKRYRFNFNNAKSLTNIDSILKKHKTKKFPPNSYAPILIDVDENGKLTQANLFPRKNYKKEIIDTIFGLNLLQNKYEEPLSDFQKLALEITRNINQWQKYYYLDLKYSVKYRRILKFDVGKDSIIKLDY